MRSGQATGHHGKARVIGVPEAPVGPGHPAWVVLQQWVSSETWKAG